MVVYRITDWVKHFENNRTRELVRLSWVPFPNKHDGDGYTELLDHKDGPAHYGAWCTIVQVASKCEPRGTLLRDGSRPHSAASISRMTRIPEPIIASAINRLISIGWIETYETPHEDATLAPKEDAAFLNGMEGNGREGKTDSAEPQKDAAPAPAVPPPELSGLVLYQGDEKLCKRWEQLWTSWRVAYPGVDLVAEIRKAHSWEVSNPKKVKKDRARFLGNWLSRAQDNCGRNAGAGRPPSVVRQRHPDEPGGEKFDGHKGRVIQV